MKKTFLALTILLSIINNHSVQAEQVIYQGSPTEATTAVVSRHEPNLIMVEGRKIRRILGAEGAFTVTPEADTGSAWIKPMSDRELMSAYVTDEDGIHYKLLLKVQDIPAETIIIKGRGLRGLPLGNKNEPRNDEILNVITAMFGGAGEDRQAMVPLWKGTRFELQKVVELRGIRGESYVLNNVSDKRIIMDEREFYRSGVQAVAIERLTLDPGQSTRVFVVAEDR